jgi:hypothetical protein
VWRLPVSTGDRGGDGGHREWADEDAALPKRFGCQVDRVFGERHDAGKGGLADLEGDAEPERVGGVAEDGAGEAGGELREGGVAGEDLRRLR